MALPKSTPAALSRQVSYVDIPPEAWATQVLAAARLGPYVDDHLLTVARLQAKTSADEFRLDLDLGGTAESRRTPDASKVGLAQASTA
jgi:hypothetical protein